MVIVMFIVINGIKIPFKDCLTFKERFKGFMFKLDEITEGLRFPHCRSIHTYFMCQNIDIIMTDKDNIIKKIYPDFRSEKFILPKKGVYYTYELPVGCANYLKVGDKLEVIEEEKKKEKKEKEKK